VGVGRGGGKGVAKEGKEAGEMEKYGEMKKEINNMSFMNECDLMKGCIKKNNKK
jgi:hypothetical protein